VVSHERLNLPFGRFCLFGPNLQNPGLVLLVNLSVSLLGVLWPKSGPKKGSNRSFTFVLEQFCLFVSEFVREFVRRFVAQNRGPKKGSNRSFTFVLEQFCLFVSEFVREFVRRFVAQNRGPKKVRIARLHLC